jgi:hypothetical protein
VCVCVCVRVCVRVSVCLFLCVLCSCVTVEEVNPKLARARVEFSPPKKRQQKS